MSYRALIEWRDLEDRHLYQPGDIYPHDGREVSPGRLALLTSQRNGCGRPLIKADSETDDKKLPDNGSLLIESAVQEDQQYKPLTKTRKASKGQKKAKE